MQDNDDTHQNSDGQRGDESRRNKPADGGSEDVFVNGRPENCPECEGILKLQGKHGQMQCTATRGHQYTWATWETSDGLTHELVAGNEVYARA